MEDTNGIFLNRFNRNILIAQELLDDCFIDIDIELKNPNKPLPRNVSLRNRADEIEMEIYRLQSELDNIQNELGINNATGYGLDLAKGIDWKGANGMD